MLTILKRERSVRMLPLSALLTVGLTAPFVGFFIEGIGPTDNDDYSSLYGLLAIVVLQCVAIVASRDFPLRVRIRDFERALPITMRRVVLERLASAWLVLFGTFAVASIVGFALTPAGTDFSQVGWMLGRAFLASGVSAALIGCYRPSRTTLHVLETVLVVGASIAAWLFSSWSSAGTWDIAYLAALVGLISYLWYALPATPLDRDGSMTSKFSGAEENESRDSLPTRLFGPLRWTILRSTLLRPQVLTIVAFSTFFLALERHSPLWGMWILAMIPFMTLRMGLNVIYGIDALPVRRERVLRVAGLASLLILIAGMASVAKTDRHIYGFESLSWGVQLEKGSEKTVGHKKGERRLHVEVPAREWRMASDPSEALITAPWGETVTPTLHPIYSGSKTFTYNPYDVQPTSTGRFLVWQVQRALAQVHGSANPSGNRFADWLVKVDRVLPISEQRFTNASSASWGYDVVEHSETPNAVGLAAFCAWLIWFLASAIALRPNVPSTRAPSWWSKLPEGTGAIVLLALAMSAYSVVRKGDRSLVPVLSERFHVWLDAQLGSSPALWAVLVLVLSGLGYAFLAWRIQRNEVPSLACNGWTKKPFPIY